MYPGRNINLTRELKLNRIVEENDTNVIVIPVETYVPMTSDFVQSINGTGLNIDDVSKRFYEQEYNSKLQLILCRNINDNCVKTELSKDMLGIFDFHNVLIDLMENVKTFRGFLENLDCKYIVTNGQVGSFIQDFAEFKIEMMQKINFDVTSTYKIGSIFGKELYVDPYMRWDDNTIYSIKGNFWDVSDYTISELTYNEPFSTSPSKILNFNIILDKDYSDFIEVYNIK